MSSAPATAATPTPAAEQPERKPGKPEGATLAQILERLQAVERLQTETLKALQETAAELAIQRREGSTATQSLAGLQRIIMSVLPAKLLRLNREQLNLLREKAPGTRVQLLAGFKAQTIDIAEGAVMTVTDDRIRLYKNMQLALVPDAASDVDERIRDLIEVEVRKRADLEEKAHRAALAAQADAAQAEATTLNAQLGRTGS
mgnify:CR=1 FL=1